MPETPATITISLQLGDHTMRFPVAWNEEVYYREAAAQLNERFKYYSSGMKGKSAEQIWVYVALEASMNLQRQNARYNIEPMLDAISKINQTITEVLDSDTTDTTIQL